MTLTSETSAKSGFVGGLYAALGLTDIFDFQLEAVYTHGDWDQFGKPRLAEDLLMVRLSRVF